MTNRLIIHRDCASCQSLLPNYVRLQLSNQPADATYPAVASHIAMCAECQGVYYREFRSQGLTTPLAQLQQVPRPMAVTFALQQILGNDQAAWWQSLSKTLHRLQLDLTLLVDQTKAVFDNLPTPFAPQPLLSDAFRGKVAPTTSAIELAEEGTHIELVRLHPPQADLAITLSVVAVNDYKSTLAVWVKTHSTTQPIAEERVTLRTDTGSLLEMSATDVDGLVIFRGLEVATYLVQVAHAGQTWEFVVPLRGLQLLVEP